MVYDPDGINPYGRELAALLRPLGPLLITAADAEWVPENVEAIRGLPSNRSRPGRVVQAARLLRSIFRAVGHGLRGSPVVIVWTRSAVEEVAFAIAAALGARIVFVLHNPGPRGRRKQRWRNLVRGVLLRRVPVLVTHGPRLAERTAEETGRTPLVVDHLPYVEWLGGRPGSSEASGILVFGQVRDYKGLDFVAAVVSRLPESVKNDRTLTIAGRGEVPFEVRVAVQAAGLRVEDRTASRFLDDEEVRALFQSCVVLVPQLDATQSGVAALALTAGLPVVAFDAGDIRTLPGLEWVVPPADVDAAATAVTAALNSAGPSAEAVDRWRARCAETWTEIVAPR